MAPSRKRENRENQFYDVGVQGRKTGITLEDRGVRDEHGLEPISGIFSSPEKSPPKRAAALRSGTITGSESMDIQESSLPDLATSTRLVRNERTHLPPPKSRSPMKTTLGSSPRRQSSMGPRVQPVNNVSSPFRAASHPAVNRRLDFDQEESSLQETPALSGSAQRRGMRRGMRRDVYDIEPSPIRAHSAVLEESMQEEITSNEDSIMVNAIAEESYVADIGNDSLAGAQIDGTDEVEESEVIPLPVKQPEKRGRKRKSDAVESAAEEEQEAPKTRRRGAAPEKVPEPQKKSKKFVAPRRSKRVSDMTEEESSAALDTTGGASELVEDASVVSKARGRPPKAKSQPEKPVPLEKKGKAKEKQKEKEDEEEPVFKKPKGLTKPKKKADPTTNGNEPEKEEVEGGKLVDVYGNPISQADLDQMSTTSAGSRFGRGRHLSVFRELDPDTVARIGRTGRHRVKPIDFWKNEQIQYDPEGNMQAIVRNEDKEPAPRKHGLGRVKGKKRALTAIEEEEEQELEPWEEDDGIFTGIYRDFDPVTEVSSSDLIEATVAWARKGIQPVDVADASFKFTKLASAGAENFLSWGCIELQADQMKRTKNSRRMHMVFNVMSGAVEVKVHENVFMVHRGGVWQVPRGNTYSIKNVGAGTSRIFFAQGCETRPSEE